MRHYGRIKLEGSTNLERDEMTVDYLKGLIDACVETAKMSKYDMAYLAVDSEGRVRAYGASNLVGLPLAQVVHEGEKTEVYIMDSFTMLFPDVVDLFKQAVMSYR